MSATNTESKKLAVTTEDAPTTAVWEPYDDSAFDHVASFAVRSTTSDCMLSAPVIKHELAGISRMALSPADVSVRIAKAKFRALIEILCGMRESDDEPSTCNDCEAAEEEPFVNSPLGLRVLVMFLLASNLGQLLLSHDEIVSCYDRCDKADYTGNQTRGGPDLHNSFVSLASDFDESDDDYQMTPLGPVNVVYHASMEDAAPSEMETSTQGNASKQTTEASGHKQGESDTDADQADQHPEGDGEQRPTKQPRDETETGDSIDKDPPPRENKDRPTTEDEVFLRTVTFTTEQEEFITSALEGLQQRLSSPPPAAKKKPVKKEGDKKLSLASDPTNTAGLQLPIEDNNKISDWDIVSRFCIDQAWDLEKTINAVLMYMNWRREHHINDLMKVGFTSPVNPGCGMFSLEEKGAHIREGYYGRDKLGRCVYYFRPDPKLMEKFLKSSKAEGSDGNIEFILWHLAVSECARYIQKRAKVDRCVAVVDMANIGLGSMTYSQQLTIMREWNTVDMQFPGNLGQIYAINVPGAISSIWSVVRHILDKQTKEKVIFLKKRGDLYKYIDKGQVPKSVLPDSDGPADFITMAQIISSFRAGTNGEADVLLTANGGFL